MPPYGDVKTRKLKSLLTRLANKDDRITIKEGAKHAKLCIEGEGNFTLPFNHRIVKKHLVEKLFKFLEEKNVARVSDLEKQI